MKKINLCLTVIMLSCGCATTKIEHEPKFRKPSAINSNSVITENEVVIEAQRQDKDKLISSLAPDAPNNIHHIAKIISFTTGEIQSALRISNYNNSLSLCVLPTYDRDKNGKLFYNRCKYIGVLKLEPGQIKTILENITSADFQIKFRIALNRPSQDLGGLFFTGKPIIEFEFIPADNVSSTIYLAK